MQALPHKDDRGAGVVTLAESSESVHLLHRVLLVVVFFVLLVLLLALFVLVLVRAKAGRRAEDYMWHTVNSRRSKAKGAGGHDGGH